MEFQAKTGDLVYRDALSVLVQGNPVVVDRVSPRGQATRELSDVTFWIARQEFATPFHVRDRLNLRIAAVESLQALAGVSSLRQLDAVSNGRFSRFADDGRLLGAYGPRLYRQLPRVEKRLRDDPDTRQAIAVLWRLDEWQTRDVPCTLSLTFRIRNGALGLKVHMRSNDVILGVPYDWFMFSLIQRTMAGVLGLETGPYVHHVDSLHLYERDLDRAVHMLDQAAIVDLVDVAPRPSPWFTAAGAAGGESDAPWAIGSWRDVADFATTALWSPNADAWFGRRVASSPLLHTESVCERCRYVVPSDEIEIAWLDTDGGERACCAWCRDHR